MCPSPQLGRLVLEVTRARRTPVHWPLLTTWPQGGGVCSQRCRPCGNASRDFHLGSCLVITSKPESQRTACRRPVWFQEQHPCPRAVACVASCLTQGSSNQPVTEAGVGGVCSNAVSDSVLDSRFCISGATLRKQGLNQREADGTEQSPPHRGSGKRFGFCCKRKKRDSTKSCWCVCKTFQSFLYKVSYIQRKRRHRRLPRGRRSSCLSVFQKRG